MLTELLEMLSTLLNEQKELDRKKKQFDDAEKRLKELLGDLKLKLIEVMPTDVYSTEEFTLTKKKDFELEIKVEELPEYYKKSQPDRAKIREALLFGMEVSGVEARPITALNIRSKK